MARNFVPNDEFLASIMNMGYTRNQACWALFRTRNTNVEQAVTWILDHPEADTDRSIEDTDSDVSGAEEDPSGQGYLDLSDFYKMVFVVNSELAMGIGKMASQVGHASISLYKQMLQDQNRFGEMLLQWEQFGETKIVLKGDNETHLTELASKAESLSLLNYLVTDAGMTQIADGSVTVLGIMGKCDIVDVVSGELSLL